MEHVPKFVMTYDVRVPDDESLQAVAAFMIGRGYATVRVTSPGTITGVDEGPFPDGDAEWWAAVEDRVVSAFAAEAGVTLFRWYAHAETARKSVRHGEAIGERTAAEAAATRLAVLSREPARAPVPEIVHRLGDPVRTGDLGAPVVLEGLDDVDWAALDDAYGTAEEVPDILRRLAANDEGWDEAVFDYYSHVVHQGTCYTCTPPAIGFLVQMARAPQLFSGYRIDLLRGLVMTALEDPGPACGEEIDDLASCEALTCRAVLDHLPDVLARWPDAGPTERAWLVVLAALSPEAAADRLPDFRAFRDGVDGPSPALDLALALASGDDDAAAGLVLDASTWDEAVGERLRRNEPLRARNLRALLHLAGREFAPG
ncbi:hypothetical protein AB0L25_24285 [Spirillospora sp. NPDC052242]